MPKRFCTLVAIMVFMAAASPPVDAQSPLVLTPPDSTSRYQIRLFASGNLRASNSSDSDTRVGDGSIGVEWRYPVFRLGVAITAASSASLVTSDFPTRVTVPIAANSIPNATARAEWVYRRNEGAVGLGAYGLVSEQRWRVNRGTLPPDTANVQIFNAGGMVIVGLVEETATNTVSIRGEAGLGTRWFSHDHPSNTAFESATGAPSKGWHHGVEGALRLAINNIEGALGAYYYSSVRERLVLSFGITIKADAWRLK